MLKSLELENFQSHTSSILELDPHFNCIIGMGNHGKTVVIRALNLLLYNQWDSSWVTFGVSHCVVTGTFPNGTKLIRKKGKKINEYIISYPDGKVQKFENFGTGVPEEVQKLTQVVPVELPSGDKVKLNLHAQFDPSFLQSITSTNKAKLFGKLSGLDVLDTVGQELSLDKRRAQTTANSKGDELVQLSAKLLKFAPLDQCAIKMEDVKQQIELVKQQAGRLAALKNLKQKMQTWETRHKVSSSRVGRYTFLDSVDTGRVEVSLDKVRQYRELKDRISKWKGLYGQLSQGLSEVNEQISTTKLLYIDCLKKEQICPTCKTQITEECLAEVLLEL